MYFKEISTVLFDLDWTLVRNPFREYILPEIYDRVHARHEYTKDEFTELLDRLFHKCLLGSINRSKPATWAGLDLIFEEFGVNVSLLRFFQKYRSEIKLYPDVLPALDRLIDRFRLGVLTNGFKVLVDLEFDQTKIAHYFEKIFIADDIGYAKPDPRFFTYALKEMRVRANNVLYVGDAADIDVPGAKEIGIATVIVNRSDKPVPHEVKPTIEIKTLRELLDHLTT